MNKNNTPDPNITVIPEQRSPYTYYESVMAIKIHHFYLSQGIEEPDKYIEMIHRIKTANPGEVIYLYLNTPGGHLDTAIQLINAMRVSQAKIVTVVEAESHSAGTLIFLCGDEFIVHDNCSMMFHNFSGGTFGKGNEMKLQIDATTRWFNKLAKDIYYPFLTHQEIDDMLTGKDIWMESEEIRKRLKKMVKILAQAQKAANKPVVTIINDETVDDVEDTKPPVKAKPKKTKKGA
jgi:ATP-dependent protease ClpP protease subunit